MKYHLLLIYDSIENSVFTGQVLTPFLKRLASCPEERGLLISFEKKVPSAKALAQLTHPQLAYYMLPQLPFVGTLSLRYAAYHLHRMLHHYSLASITARGPLAGWIIGHVAGTNTVPSLIQARGLAAQEYAYAHAAETTWWRKSLHHIRMQQYVSIEHWVYGSYARHPSVTIEAVSNTLGNYLVTTFNTPGAGITIAAEDIPPTVSSATIAAWRTQMRCMLGIDENAYVYVYNGSAKAWQCPAATVTYFANEYHRNKNTFLLILTQDTAPFEQLCLQAQLPSHAFCIITIAHHDMYQYLAAADAGILLRDSHIINWISRPTKVLEYKAVGLIIIHNNTVAMLANTVTTATAQN
jgi:hypothetical protein